MKQPPAKPERELVEQLKRALPDLTRQVHRDYLDEIAKAQKKKTSETGIIGRLIGDADHAPYAIALIVVVLSFALIAVIVIRDPREKLVDAVAAALLALLSASIGYAFGNRGRQSGGRR